MTVTAAFCTDAGPWADDAPPFRPGRSLACDLDQPVHRAAHPALTIRHSTLFTIR